MPGTACVSLEVAATAGSGEPTTGTSASVPKWKMISPSRGPSCAGGVSVPSRPPGSALLSHRPTPKHPEQMERFAWTGGDRRVKSYHVFPHPGPKVPPEGPLEGWRTHMTVTNTRLRTVAAVLAGGTGSRVGLDIKKQLLLAAIATAIAAGEASDNTRSSSGYAPVAGSGPGGKAPCTAVVPVLVCCDVDQPNTARQRQVAGVIGPLLGGQGRCGQAAARAGSPGTGTSAGRGQDCQILPEVRASSEFQVNRRYR